MVRADARANRDALLQAARRLYADRGATVPYSLIALEAGLGIGTLYRHFPTPDDLLVGLVAQLRDQVVEICERCTATMPDNPDNAWSAFVHGIVDLELGAFLPQLLKGRSIDDLPADVQALRTTVLAEIGSILDRAKVAGLVRPDVTPLHFQAGIGAFTRPLPPLIAEALPELRAWLAEVYLAGLRP